LLAILFAAATATYSGLWIEQVRQSPRQPGFVSYQYSPATGSMLVGDIVPGSPADQAGLQTGDRVVAIDGNPLANLHPFYTAIVIGRKDVIHFTVDRPSSAGGQRRLEVILRGGKPASMRMTRLEHLLSLPISYYPVGFLIVGLTVLFLRLDDPHAWLLAVLFGSFLAGGPLFEAAIPPHLRGFAVAYKIVMLWLSGALFYYFFAVFPSPSPFDRKLPWLKYVLLALAIIAGVPIGVRCLFAGGTLPLYLGTRLPAATATTWLLAGQAGLPVPAPHGSSWSGAGVVFFGSLLGATTLGLLSLLSNNFFSADLQVRRKAHVILWGTLIGVAPVTVAAGASFMGGPIRVPLVVWQACVVLLSTVWPMSFAYAVAKHRVLEIPVLFKRSARYVLVQRGYLILLFAAAATTIVLFTHAISRFFPEGTNIGIALSTTFGIALVWASAPMVKRGTERIDQIFFRSAYDARLILQDLAEKTRTVANRHELVKMLETHIEGALHPKSLACYLDAGDGNLKVECASSPGEPGKIPSFLPRTKFPFRFGAVFIPRELDTIPATLPLLTDIAQRGKAWDIFPSPEALSGPLTPECVVPILGRNCRLIGLLLLGPRLSEESYSSEDKRLLESVASQAGITLENLDLAEKIAERMQAERNAAIEIDIARRVQARLFPQYLPALKSLEYVGGCLQARQVGGDYYDFLNMGPGVIGIVLADISGKGIAAALLMANLQANLRTQYAIAREDLPRLLESVNRLFYENTTDESYATMFFAVYDDRSRSLRFANCGQVPPVILRSDGCIQRLTSTTTVLGLFLKWESATDEAKLNPGDLLVIYTDGVTEAPNSEGEEFGEARLVELIRKNRNLPVNEVLAAIQEGVQEFSPGPQADDITLIVARCH
jgi:phosphoserine phosphatase RsbU/P